MVMWWEWVGGDIWFVGRCNHLVVNEILNLITQSKALVGVVTVLLVNGTIFGQVMGWWEVFL